VSYYKEGPPTDPAPVLKKIEEIVVAAPELTEFEARFLKEVSQAALKFRDQFRMSPKQLNVLNGLWTKHTLATRIDAKIKKKAK
jgi:hypothetical protein